MSLDVLRKRVERTLYLSAVLLVGGGNSQLREKCRPKGIRCKHPVQVAAMNPTVRRNRALRSTVEHGERTSAIRAFSMSDVDFVSIDRLFCCRMGGCHARQRLLRRHDG